MALKQETVIMHRKDASGNTVMQFPITRGENIESAVPVTAGGTGATTVAGARNALGLGNTSGAVPVANGGTGATTAANARTNLGLSTAVTSASISGKTITLTKADGSTTTLTTQDTVSSNWTFSNDAKGYAKDNSTGFIIQWGKCAAGTSSFTFATPFTTVLGAWFSEIVTKNVEGNTMLPTAVTTTGCTFYETSREKMIFAIGYKS